MRDAVISTCEKNFIQQLVSQGHVRDIKIFLVFMFKVFLESLTYLYYSVWMGEISMRLENYKYRLDLVTVAAL